MSDRQRPPFGAFDDRLKKLRSAAEDKRVKEEGKNPGYGPGVQAGIDVVAGVVFGAGAGWLIDHWLGSLPIGLSLGLMLGGAAGVRNAYRTMQRIIDASDERGDRR